VKKLIATLLLLASITAIADAAIITRPTKTTGGTSYNDGTIPHASDFNGDADTVYNDYNGNITNANISGAAAIAGSKISAQFTTNVQVTSAAVPCFVNIDSSLGVDLKQWRICQNAGVLSIATFTDAGAVIITPMSIVRATGLTTFVGGLTLSTGNMIISAGNITVSGTATLTSLTANSFLYSGTAGLLTTTVAPTNGQLLIGSTGAAPVRAAITGTANEITVTNSAGGITLDIPVGAIFDTATATADPGAALGLATKQYVDAQIALLIPSGTKMVLNQTNCPAGWTKDVASNDKALRLVNGAVGSGGSVAFTTAFAAGTIPTITDSHTLTTAEMPSHTHVEQHDNQNTGSAGSANGIATTTNGTDTATATTSTQATGGGGGHTHTITSPSLAVSYVDVILCSKN